MVVGEFCYVFFFKQKTAYEMRISDWSSDVCSSDLVRLTIDAGLQAYAARRLGTQSGSVVVMDCLTGDVLTLASLPSFAPNRFSDGTSHLEWNMMAEVDHVPLRTKKLPGLYSPGSPVKPLAELPFLVSR